MRYRTAIGSAACLTMLLCNGCVLNSTYEAAIKDAETIKTALRQTQEEQEALARLLEELGKSNRAALQETETIAAAVRQAKIDADTERRQAEAHQAELKMKIPQLIRQHTAIQGELAVAKENHAALQELVEVYQKKLAELPKPVDSPMSPGTTFTARALDPAPLPPMQAAPEPSMAEKLSEPEKPQEAPVPSGTVAEPADSGWLSAIKNWIRSILESLF